MERGEKEREERMNTTRMNTILASRVSEPKCLLALRKF